MENGRLESTSRGKRLRLNKASTLIPNNRREQVPAYAAGIAVPSNTQIPRGARDDKAFCFQDELLLSAPNVEPPL